MTTFTLPTLPADLEWVNAPTEWRIDPPAGLAISAGEKTDWFIDPAGALTVGSAPVALFTPPDEQFILSAKVRVAFASDFDAGVLFVSVRPREAGSDDVWAKLCFEYSPQHKPMIVSVVTRGTSDDCNSVTVDGDEVYLRIFRSGPTFAFHYSVDGRLWHMVRYFTLGALDGLRVGFEAQSPTGRGCVVVFSEISYRQGAIKDIRSGE